VQNFIKLTAAVHKLSCLQSMMLKTIVSFASAGSKTCETAIYSHTIITELERTGEASGGAAVIG